MFLKRNVFPGQVQRCMPVNSCCLVDTGTEISKFLESRKQKIFEETCHTYTNITPMHLFAIMISYLKMRISLIKKEVKSAIVGKTKFLSLASNCQWFVSEISPQNSRGENCSVSQQGAQVSPRSLSLVSCQQVSICGFIDCQGEQRCCIREIWLPFILHVARE